MVKPPLNLYFDVFLSGFYQKSSADSSCVKGFRSGTRLGKSPSDPSPGGPETSHGGFSIAMLPQELDDNGKSSKEWMMGRGSPMTQETSICLSDCN